MSEVWNLSMRHEANYEGEAPRQELEKWTCDARCQMSVFGVFIAAVQHQPQWAEMLWGEKGSKVLYKWLDCHLHKHLLQFKIG